MKGETPSVKYLKDYSKPSHKIETVDLIFDLHDTRTIVTNTMKVIPVDGATTLVLNGEEIGLKSVRVNGEVFDEKNYEHVDNHLTIKNLPTEEFELRIINTNNPEKNTALDGLYKSGGIFCTQNEPEGFRRITFFMDRPDNLSVYSTKIIADKKVNPILLANGNLVESGDLDEGKHYAVWKDPFPKPSYLYALVAGDLGVVEDKYTTVSGREVKLQIFVDKGNESKCHHAMESLKNSMKWDEERFGLEYDLDIYMIVAVDSFNMGAMENKGLNIFNSAYVLADRETATDDNYFGIEAVIGHEYFHNWTGNRVTCRDWFQLTLKEGLTVFRDQEFSADLNSRAVCRINDVKGLRSHQFAEDAGPTAHPIKPKSYIEMNNFYTSTIYEKGSEVIRMIYTLLGRDGFRKGMDKYFELFDGQAVTTEDFVHAMSVANNNYDFSQFSRWYDQAGTPVLDVNGSYDADKKEFTLIVKQSCPATPEQPTKEAFHMPLMLGLVNDKGADVKLTLSNREDQQDLDRGLLHIKCMEETFVFTNVDSKVIPSVNRQFSAPVRINSNLSTEDLSFLMANDNDEFNRYEAAQVYAKGLLHEMVKTENYIVDVNFVEAWGKILKDKNIDDAFKALCLLTPSVKDLILEQDIINAGGAHTAYQSMRRTLAVRYISDLKELYKSLDVEEEFKVDAMAMGKRELKNVVLGYLSYTEEGSSYCTTQYESASNMTDRMGALTSLVHGELKNKDNALNDYYNKFKDQTLVMQKWLTVQASSKHESTYDTVLKLMKDEVYDDNVPNLVRSLIGAFVANEVQFYHSSGRGIKFAADQIRKLDKINPQVASRIASVFKNLKKMPEDLKKQATSELEEIVKIDGLSKNVYEIISKTLA